MMTAPREMVELLAGVDFDIPALPAADLPVEPVAYFASGCQRGEVSGFGDIGHDVGVVADRCNDDVVAELLALAGTDIQVFCDSGAFSEVTKSFPFQVKKAMTDTDWQRIIALYKRLGAVLGDQLFVVAPDRVGDQDVTLERLARYAADMRELDAMGVRVLVVAQKGRLSQAAMYKRACDILGFEAFPALPCKKAATTPAETRAFVREVKPLNLHLLGLGVRNANAAAHLSAIADECDTLVTMDSCVAAAHSGKTGGPNKGARRLTLAARVVDSLVGRGLLSSDVSTRKRAGVLVAFGSLIVHAAGTQLNLF